MFLAGISPVEMILHTESKMLAVYQELELNSYTSVGSDLGCPLLDTEYSIAEDGTAG